MAQWVWLRSHWSNVVVGILLFVLVVVTFSGKRARVFDSAPVVTKQTVVETPVLKWGDTLSIYFVIDKNKLCRQTIDQFILKESDRTVVWRHETSGGAAALGKDRRVKYMLPFTFDEMRRDGVTKPFPPGKYFYRGTVHSDCGDDGQHSTEQPNGHFEVVE